MQTFELYSVDKENAKIEVCSLVKGWIERDVETNCEHEDDEEDETPFDPPTKQDSNSCWNIL